MAEDTLDVRDLATSNRAAAWAALEPSLVSLCDALAKAHDDVAAMATFACVVHQGFGFLWTGFYRVVSPSLLRVGPYQGTLGCLEIPFGRGVCGTAATTKATVVVDDVETFPGHIACDGRSRSEIVVPVFDARGTLRAVLDIDSDEVGTFSDVDRVALEALVHRCLTPVFAPNTM